MSKKPSYEELEQRVRDLEQKVSNLKQAEEKIDERVIGYNKIFQSSLDCVYLHDLEGNFIDANPVALDLFGYTREEITSLNLASLVSEDDLLRASNALQGTIEMGVQNTFFEYEAKKKNGDYVYIEAKGFVLYRKGKPYAIMGIGRNITERKKFEEALRESEERYRTLQENIPVGIFRTSINGKLLYVNPEAAKLFGFDARVDLSAYRIVDFYKEPEKRQAVIIKLKTEGKITDFITEFKRKDGSFFWGSISATMSTKKDGNFIYVDGIIKDVSEYRRAEENLLQEKIFTEAIVNSLPGVFYVYDENQRLVRWNKNHEIISGYTAEESFLKPQKEFFEPKDVEKINQFMKQVFEEGEATGESYVVAKDGSKGLFYFTGTRLIQNNKKYVLGVGIDITDRKRAEKEKEALQHQLQHAQKMEAIGTLAGGIAHDFNNLLMGILGNTSLMLIDIDSHHSHYEKLKNIEQLVQSGTELTGQLLRFARGGKYEVKTTDLNALVNKSVRMFGRTSKGIMIHRKLRKDLWAVNVDQGQFERVLLNLYANSWQAMPGGGNLYIETGNVLLDENYIKPFEVKPGRYARISVTDTGHGMDESTLKKIFDPFFTTKEMGKGTGLGLASVYGIVKNHNGVITVYSEKGKGATFKIYLPATSGKITEAEEGTLQMLTGEETVLLVDDEEMMLNVGRQMLEKLGYNVYVAEGGKKAIEVYEKHQSAIQLVIIDMIMPETSGGETCDRLRELNPNVKTLLSSGYSVNGDATEILSRGCDGFIQKPFNLIELSQKIRKILDQKPLHE
ncbi:MAG: PAS domain S-box protein [Desulfobacterales bacterium]